MITAAFLRPSAPLATRMHVGLGTRDLAASVAFYTQLFATGPDKLRADYARFTPAEPWVHLSLNVESTPAPLGRVQHYGIQVADPEMVRTIAARLHAAGLPLREQFAVVCCHARQDKVWISDPDGRDWEIFATTDDAPVETVPGTCGMAGSTGAAAASACCAPTSLPVSTADKPLSCSPRGQSTPCCG